MEAWKAYGEFARRLQGSETRTEDNRIKGKVTIKKYGYRQNGAGAILRTFPVEGMSDDETVMVQNERYTFEVRAARQNRDQYVLLEYHPNQESKPDSSVRDTVFIRLSPHYCFDYQKPWLLFDPASRVKVRKTARVPTPEGERYRVDFDGEITDTDPRQFKRVKGHILFDPGRKWCIDRADYKEEYFLNGERGSESNVVLSFITIPHSSGFPLVSKQIQKLTGYSFRRQWKMELNTEVNYQAEVSADDDESPFLLTAFGIREPFGMMREKRAPRYVWFLAAAGVFMALAIGFRYLARRTQAVQPA